MIRLHNPVKVPVQLQHRGLVYTPQSKKCLTNDFIKCWVHKCAAGCCNPGLLRIQILCLFNTLLTICPCIGCAQWNPLAQTSWLHKCRTNFVVDVSHRLPGNLLPPSFCKATQTNEFQISEGYKTHQLLRERIQRGTDTIIKGSLTSETDL